MSYAIDITPEAAENLARLPLPVAEYLYQRIVHDLGDSPASVSFPSGFPYPIMGQAYECEYDFEGTHYRFHVCFQYGQDEQTLHLLFIGVVQKDTEA